MATFDSLLASRSILRVTVRVPNGQFHDRKFFAYPDCLRWMRDDVPKMVTGRVNSAFSPREQLNERLRQWMSGDPMAYCRMFHDMKPAADNVWELKTADLRIFGWMYRPKQFIAFFGGYADDYKDPCKTKTYGDARRSVVKARNTLPLDGAKFTPGDFDDLV